MKRGCKEQRSRGAGEQKERRALWVFESFAPISQLKLQTPDWPAEERIAQKTRPRAGFFDSARNLLKVGTKCDIMDKWETPGMSGGRSRK
jgi:hypothetical protein